MSKITEFISDCQENKAYQELTSEGGWVGAGRPDREEE